VGTLCAKVINMEETGVDVSFEPRYDGGAVMARIEY
jgi:hypothetical protein